MIMKKKRWIIVGVIVILAVCVAIPTYNYLSASPIQKILNKYGGSGTNYNLISVQEIPRFLNYASITISQKEALSALAPNQGVLEVFFRNRLGKHGVPNEVYAIFECYLYVKEKPDILDLEVAAIFCEHSSGQIDDVDFKSFCITKDEFEALYAQYSSVQKEPEEMAVQLGDAWINQVHYNRDELEYTPETEYRKNLGTRWNESYNAEKNRQLRYFGGYDEVPNRIVEYGPNGSGTEIDVSEERGYIYFIWDENDQIWIYGKTIGLRRGLVNRLSGPIEGSEPPEPLKRVMETVAQ